jgi:methylenetetrahydrofolate reductase (NADPH)
MDEVQVSFEFFPPHSAAMEKTLWNSLQRLKELQPSSMKQT